MHGRVAEVLLGLCLLMALAACVGEQPVRDVVEPTPTLPSTSSINRQTIWEILTESEEYQIFVALVERAGVVEILSERTGLTVFAPTDRYLEKLPPQTLQRLQELEAQELRKILLHHIVEKTITRSDVLAANVGCDVVELYAESMEGTEVFYAVGEAYHFEIADAYITKSDILASNGRIHIVDSLLVPLTSPEWLWPITDLVLGRGHLEETRMQEAIYTALRSEPLSNELGFCFSGSNYWFSRLDRVGSYILLEPTDSAFEALGDLDLSDIRNQPFLESLIRQHLFKPSRVSEGAWQNDADVELQFLDESTIQVGEKRARILETLPALNGTIYVIDAVMLP